MANTLMRCPICGQDHSESMDEHMHQHATPTEGTKKAASPLLTLAESYYSVAKDLERSANESLAIARMLNDHADKLCAQNIRETAPHTRSAPP